MYTCHNRHKYYLKCHLIFVCKYRKRLLDGNMQQIIKDHFWKEHTFWSDGYFVCSIGEASSETVRRYIKNQG